jgi:phosphoserine phosphatase RsbU/P
MATITDPFLRTQLEERKHRLEEALARAHGNASVTQLLQEVDSALERMDNGTYGVCEECHDTIEKDRLLADPLVRVCLDHLTTPERRRLEADLELAARVQQKLLPSKQLNVPGWCTHYHYEAVGPVSGDYCDLIPSENGSGSFLFLLGDVSGKGVAASMLMARLHAMIRSLATLDLPIDQLMGQANRLLCESTIADQFATLVCGRMSRMGDLEMTGAGHCPVLAVRNRDVAQLESTGMPLGMFSNAEYCVHRTRLEPGDSLFLFTDGVTETRDRSGEEYGVDRLAKFVRERRALPPEALTGACLDDLRTFSSGASRTDDLTLLVIRREDRPSLAPA